MYWPSIPRLRALSKYKKVPLTDAGVGTVFGSSAGYAAARIAVRIRPGLTLFTRMFGSPSSSSASMLRTDSNPVLETAYAPQKGRDFFTTPLLTKMMDASLDLRRCGNRICVRMNGAVRFTCKTLHQVG